MKYSKFSLIALVVLTMSSWSIPLTARAGATPPQGQSTALERGYRTGYSDGFSAGARDEADHLGRDYRNKDDYQHGDRSYNEAWGTVEDYRDGYQQGFEAGYNAGFDRRPFDSSIPTGLTRRGNGDAGSTNPPDNSGQNSGIGSEPTNGTAASGPLILPRDSMLLIELQSGLSTDASQRGDRFQARVIDPREFEGAIVEGRVTRVKRAGKVKGTAELQLSFETIHMDNRTSGFNADVVEIVDAGNSESGRTVDSEGGVKGRDSTKDNISKVGAATGIGAIIGAVVGGGKGAAIGAAIGAGVGTGSVLSKRGDDVRLERGQQLRIRTATETRMQ